MKQIMFVVLSALLLGCNTADSNKRVLQSPDGKIQVRLALDSNDISYSISRENIVLFEPSSMALKLRGQDDIVGPFSMIGHDRKAVNESWEPVWGQEARIVDHYNELKLALQEIAPPQRHISIYFRAYDDGVAFRYEIPQQLGIDSLFILDERTEFNFSQDGRTWWNEGSYLFDTPEQLYHETPLSAVDSAHTPMTMIRNDGIHISIHEAALYNYAAMTLRRVAGQELSFVSALVPWPDGDKVKTRAPMISPWRTITIGENAADLLRSRLILNLNEPTQFEDVSWIRPMKYVGIWWGMHINKYTWVPGDRHGATTENTKRYIDFAAEHAIQGVLVEGWNTGWELWGQPGAVDFIHPYDDFDLDAVTQYASAKGVSFIGHHETTANVAEYEPQMEQAYALYQSLGVHAIKSGYVGEIKPSGQFHYGQWMVEHFQRAVELAAKYQISLDVHEPIKDTGISRTWPNMMTREGARGMEYNAWSSGNPPDHTTILPFTRLLAGPMDYTPGIFDLTLDNYKPENAVHTTLAKQLALMVVLYSPLQMAADLPENYEDQPAFQFIEDLARNWDETRVLSAEIAEQVALARRAGDEWFIGAITNEFSRTLVVPLSDLIQDDMVADTYTDGPGAHWDSNPYPIHIGRYVASPGDTLKATLAPGGGLAIRLSPATTMEPPLVSIQQLYIDQISDK